MLINFKEKNRLMKLLSEQKIYDELSWANKSDTVKLFHKNSQKAGKYRWNFPFIDVFFYEENETHILRKTNVKGFEFTAPKSQVFPLKLRPFGQYWMPVARDMFGFITSTGMKNFDQMCSSSSWNHRYERKQDLVKTKCSQLNKYYSFVETSHENSLQMVRLDSQRLVYLIDFESKSVVFRVDL